ncbi:MAG TPA: alanine racemase [Alphaproteobacteria bacterium]|nr:alanine racemase [Alphaproteobacteria bacterium]
MSHVPLPSQSVLTVDLGAIVANYRLLRSRLTGAECAVVVKADAYGLGAIRVAPALAAAGARHFFVAQLGEALEIRDVLPPETRIYVLNGMLPGEAEEFRARGVVPVLNDLGQIEAWSREAQRSGRKLPATLHFDTGMSRLGLSNGEADRLIAGPRHLEHIEVAIVMSHLACADEPGHPLNASQRDAFASRRRAFPQVPASLANSSGIFLGPQYHFDLARPGCALYGINPTPGHPNPVGQVARLSGKILQIRDVDPPKTVGYGATHRVTATTRVATIAAGYADGWLRSLSNRGSAYFGDLRVPIVGRVSMDLITLDVSSAPQIKVGDTVELMGDRLPVDDVAAKAGTIGYEVLTRLGRRFARVYVDLPAST